MWLLAQQGEGVESLPFELLLLDLCFSLFGLLMSVGYFAFWIWMLIYCVRRDPERDRWLWIILVFHPIGTALYFFTRFLPSANFRMPSVFRRWSRGNEIRRLEYAADQIGNAHQFIELGETLLDVGRYADAADAFHEAVQKESDSLPALWGSARADSQLKNHQAARVALEQILKQDRRYKFGDASLLYGKCLEDCDELELARDHFREHVKQWRQPEGLYLLASLEDELGDPAAARSLLKTLLLELDASPPAIARKHVFWRGRARRLLNRLGK